MSLTVRSKGVKMITRIHRSRDNNNIREFHLPKLNFLTKTYYELVHFPTEGRSVLKYQSMFKGNLPATEPPLLAECTDLNQFINMPLAINYPSHTLGVERAVKLTTQATKRIAGQKRQIGEALYAIAGRKKPWIAKGKANNYVSRKTSLQI